MIMRGVGPQRVAASNIIGHYDPRRYKFPLKGTYLGIYTLYHNTWASIIRTNQIG